MNSNTSTRKTGKAGLLIIALVLGAMASESALAFRGGRGRGPSVSFGVFVGAPAFAYPFYARPYYYPSPFFYPPAYYYPPVYSPPVVIQPAPPPVYIEQGFQQPQGYSQPVQQQPQAAPVESSWYYCAESQAYYPYAKQCAGGWQRVTPQPPG